VFMDGDGLDFSSGMAKNVERIFYKENFRRAHHNEPGAIIDIFNVPDFYREGFLRAVNRELLIKAAWTVVIDFNHSPASQVLPMILNELGCNVIALNAYVDEGRTANRPMDKQSALEQLSKIVTSLGAQAGFWLDQTAESVTMVDESGRILSGIELLTLFASLTIRSGQKGAITVPVQAPSTIEKMAEQNRCRVVRTKSSDRAMLEAASSSEVILAGSTDGRLAIPAFQASFDGMFTIVRAMELGIMSGMAYSKALETVPVSAFMQTSITCPWEMKGGIMRKMSEDSLDLEASFIDGIKVHFGHEWALVLPDQYTHHVHIFVEANDQKSAQKLLSSYQSKVEKWKKELE
jgi:mannose-1-phosphate guanylyltransferase / phosphomannomutase